MTRTPSEIAREVYDSPEEFALTRMNTEVENFKFFKQVAAVHWIERNTELP